MNFNKILVVMQFSIKVFTIAINLLWNKLVCN